MRNLTFFAIAAAAVAVAAPAQAQQRVAVLVVDTERAMNECTACRAAAATINQQRQSAQQLQTSLMQPLQTEAQQLEAAQKALGNKQPDAALRQRAQSFEQRYNSARQQLAQRAQTIQSTEAHVQQQLGNRLVAITEQIRARRGATIVVSKNSTLANDNTADITGEVLAALNQQLPAVSVTPLPQTQQQQQPSR